MSEKRTIKRYDRHGRPEYAPSTRPAALRAVATTIDREARADQKARQDAGQLTPQERLLSAIFGEIK